MGNREVVTEFNKTEFSKFLAYILRHHPEEIGLQLQESGWVDTSELLNAINNNANSNYSITFDMLNNVVQTDEKQRYSFKEGNSYIRANQGHSIKNLNMNYSEITPPDKLFHGTSERALRDILSSGSIKSMQRQYVHLSHDYDIAIKVGKRHGKPVVLCIDCNKAINSGVKFYMAENGVYLSTEIPTNCFNIVA
jgi:putative RNA 2'-phosphotransferase